MPNPRPAHARWWLPFFAAASLAPTGCLDLTIPDPPDGASDAVVAPDARPGVDLGSGDKGSGGHATGGQPTGTGGGLADANGAGGAGGTTTNATGGVAASGGGAGAVASGGAGGTLDAGAGDGGASTDGREGEAGDTAGDAGPESPRDLGAPDLRAEAASDGAADLPVPDAAPDATAKPLPAGLVAYYPCEAAQGALLPDQSGNGHHGTLPTSSAGFRFEAGKLGNGLVLVQSGSGYVSLPPAIFAGAGELTVASWVRLTTATLWQRLFDVGVDAHQAQNAATGTQYVTFFFKDFGGKLGLSSTNDGYGSAQQVTAPAVAVETWKHVAVVLGGGGATLYLDGAAAGNVPSLLPPQALGNIDYAFLGKSQFTGDPFLDGQIDELRIYRRALDAAEIEVLASYRGP